MKHIDFYMNSTEFYILPSIEIETQIKAVFINWLVFHIDIWRYR